MTSKYKAESSAFILHRRDYGESSRILSCFTRDYGRVDMVCKGCRRQGKASKVLEPFRSYHLSWTGKTELKTLTHVDEGKIHTLYANANQLYCGLYLNELLNGLIKAAEVDADLFDLYESTLCALAAGNHSMVQLILRRFELNMLQCMGYGISLEYEHDGATLIDADCQYGFRPEHGFFKATSRQEFLLNGDSILALNAGCLNSVQQERETRNLTRLLIGYYLPNTKIQSRQLFAS